MILITGALGFIGSHVTIDCLQRGEEVIGLDDLSNATEENIARIKKESDTDWRNFTFFRGSITNRDMVNAIMINYDIEHVIHLAAIGSVTRSFVQPQLVTDVNCGGFANVLNAMVNYSPKTHLTYASSSSVYGHSGRRREEIMESRPLSPYALSKAHNETMAEMYNVKAVGLRFFNVYGPGQRADSDYSAVIPKFMNGKEIEIFGDGSVIRDFTYVSDVVGAIRKAREVRTGLFNVGTGIGTSIKQLAEMIANGKPIKISPEKQRQREAPYSVAEPSVAEMVLNFKADVTLDSGLERMRNG